jgi:Ca-activated chloride channel family protein
MRITTRATESLQIGPDASRRSMLLLLAAGVPCVLHGWQQDYVVRSNANLIVLDVAVLGSDGQPVPGLAKDRFVVAEDGKRQAIKQFAAEESPVSIGFVLDMSSSMHRKLDGVYRAVSSLLRASNPEDEYFLVGFNDRPALGLPQGMPFSHSQDDIRQALRSFRPQGRTALYDGLILALDHVEKSNYERRVLVLVSDGKDTASTIRVTEALRHVRSSPITIYTIGLFDETDPDRDEGLLKRLAHIAGGKFFHPSSPEELEQYCLRIARDIRARYTLAYTPPEEPRSGIRKIKVELLRSAKQPKMSVLTRSEYTMDRPEKSRSEMAR